MAPEHQLQRNYICTSFVNISSVPAMMIIPLRHGVLEFDSDIFHPRFLSQELDILELDSDISSTPTAVIQHHNSVLRN
jgi:hypothetical protein